MSLRQPWPWESDGPRRVSPPSPAATPPPPADELCQRLGLPNPLDRQQSHNQYARETIDLMTGQLVEGGTPPEQARAWAEQAAHRHDDRNS